MGEYFLTWHQYMSWRDIKTWHYMTWLNLTWHEITWHNMTWYDWTTWLDITWHNMTWHDMTRRHTWYDMTCCDVTFHDTTWHDIHMTWYDMIWPDDMAWHYMVLDIKWSDMRLHLGILMLLSSYQFVTCSYFQILLCLGEELWRRNYFFLRCLLLFSYALWVRNAPLV